MVSRSGKSSSDILFDLLSSEPTHQFLSTEIYELSGTFFAYIYEKLGPDSLMRFYELLTGSAFQKRAAVASNSFEKRFKKPDKDLNRGNVVRCLNEIPKDFHWTFNSVDEFINGYLTNINEKVEK